MSVSVEPLWESVRDIRQRVGELLKDHPEELRAATMMAASELLENAVKYAECSARVPRVAFDLGLEDGALQITTTNPMADRAKLQHLSSVLDKLATTPDPERLYLDRIQQRSGNAADLPNSGLGLYRVAAEGHFRLAHRFRDDMLSVIASRSITVSDHVCEQDGLTWAVAVSPEQATIYWRGVADSRHPGTFLNPLIDEWASKLKNVEVTVDLSQLEFMNSATVTPLVNLVKALDANGKPVRVMFLDVEWQRIHGNCMRAIARTLKHVRVERQTG